MGMVYDEVRILVASKARPFNMKTDLTTDSNRLGWAMKFQAPRSSLADPLFLGNMKAFGEAQF